MESGIIISILEGDCAAMLIPLPLRYSLSLAPALVVCGRFCKGAALLYKGQQAHSIFLVGAT